MEVRIEKRREEGKGTNCGHATLESSFFIHNTSHNITSLLEDGV